MSLRPEGSDRVMCCLKPNKNDSEDKAHHDLTPKGPPLPITQFHGERLRRAEGKAYTPKKETQGSYPQLGTPKAQASSPPGDVHFP